MSEQKYQAKLAYNAEYNRNAYKAITFRLSKTKDADLIEYLEGADVTALLRMIIREHKSKVNLKERMRSRRTKKLKHPYVLMELDADKHWHEIAGADDLDAVKMMEEDFRILHADSDTCIVKRYMNKYGTIVAVRIRQ